MMKIIGPFQQIITMDGLPIKGVIKDSQLEIIKDGGVLIENGMILEVDIFEHLIKIYPSAFVEKISAEMVLLPGFIDCHTHGCFAGSRAMDFAERNAGTSYLDIAAKGGGIWSSVTQTRVSTDEELKQLTEDRVNTFLKNGITTIEIKTGYGLSVDQEIRLLQIINRLDVMSTVIPTCLAAHVKPSDFNGNNEEYLNHLLQDLLPQIKSLTNRIDIFTEQSAFSIEESKNYLTKAMTMGYKITVHADQFTSGSAMMAVQLGALSADHLEATNDNDISLLALSQTVAVALPGASIGLGEPFAPVRKILDAGGCVAIASDYNPGSAPMGDLLAQASILATYQKLSTAEVFAGLTYRAAKALDIHNTGMIKPRFQADLQAYATNDYRAILYHQGQLKPSSVWKNGENIYNN